VTLAGDQSASPGSVLAVSVGPNTPFGFLGRIVSASHTGGRTVVETEPATIEQAIPQGSFDLSQATPVSGVTADVQHSWIQGDDDEGTSALLSGSLSASGDCTYDRTAVLAKPVDLGTFYGDVLGVPVVVGLEGRLYLDGQANAQGSISAGVTGKLSASGGLACKSRRASVISPSASLSFGVQEGPSASLGARVTPELLQWRTKDRMALRDLPAGQRHAGVVHRRLALQ